MKLDIVLISGKQGSGKSTLAAEIRKHIANDSKSLGIKWVCEELIFAGAIYEMHNFCRSYLGSVGVETPGAKDGTLLQLLGTEWGRKTLGEDIWVRVLRGKVLSHSKAATDLGADRLTILIPDTRFKNELDFYPAALKIRLECSEYVRRQRCSAWRSNTNHPSEVDLDDCIESFDLVLDSENIPSDVLARKIVFDLHFDAES